MLESIAPVLPCDWLSLSGYPSELLLAIDGLLVAANEDHFHKCPVPDTFLPMLFVYSIFECIGFF